MMRMAVFHVLTKQSNEKFEPMQLQSVLKNEFYETGRLEKLFETNIRKQKELLLEKINTFKHQGKKIYALGASTKGNVLLQYYNLSSEQIEAIGEVNKEKVGSYTPGTNIPILHEEEVLSDPDGVYLILPWHFKNFFINQQKFNGKQLIFPLPQVDAR